MSLSRFKKREENNAARNAGIAGAIVTGVPAAFHSAYHSLRDMEDFERVPQSMSYENFHQKLQPGDVLYHRHSFKDSPMAALTAKTEMPITENQLLTLVKGDPFYHSSIYRGGGKMTEAAGMDEGVKNTQLKTDMQKTPADVLAYRPKNKRLVPKALDFAEEAIGAPYKNQEGLLEHGLKHIVGMGEKTGCKVGPKGLVCSELSAEAYPSIFKDRFMSPADMRHHPEMELIGRYQKAEKLSNLERFLGKVGYPILKNLKYGIPAAGLAYLASGDDDNG